MPIYRPKNSTFHNLTGAIADFVILDMQPANVVEAPSLARLLRTAARDSSLVVPSRPTVMNRVEAMAIEARYSIQQMLKDTRPALTTDIWTANDGVSAARNAKRLCCCCILRRYVFTRFMFRPLHPPPVCVVCVL